MEAALASAPVHVTRDLPAAAWDTFVAQHPSGTVEHLFAWRAIFSRVFGHVPVYLAAMRGGQVTGVLPLVQINSVLFGRSMVSLPYANYAGLLACDSESGESLLHEAECIARTFRASHVEIRNVQRHTAHLPYRSHKVGSRLRLPAGAEELWRRLDRKLRNQVRKAQKTGLEVESGGAALLPDFYQVFARNMRDLGTPVFPRALFEEALQLPVDARVFVVRRSGVALAAAIWLGWRGTVLVPWASSLREHRHLCANVLVYWHMLEAAIASSYTVFDFGRSTPSGGTHQFKQQWDAIDVPLHWEYLLLNQRAIPDRGPASPRLRLFVSAWRHLPMTVANAVGPAVIRQLPG